MSVDWIQPTIGLLFLVIWLISVQIIVGERGTSNTATPRPSPTVSDCSKQPVIHPQLD
jgi:hypothetical protein